MQNIAIAIFLACAHEAGKPHNHTRHETITRLVSQARFLINNQIRPR